ncbi:MAG: HAMP domain-containing histidine kinase [Algicola sp.]|nr:HAMP domain-containing histidine kinase [Algicola sp.]
MEEPISTEDKLRERIKELTCLYTISSYIANADLNNLTPTLEAIARSLCKAIQFPEEAVVELFLDDIYVECGKDATEKVFMLSAIKAFNQPIGSVKVGYPKETYSSNSFLEEEKQMLNAVALELGDLFERKQIVESDMRSKRQVERVDRLTILGEITAGIAHELNTPLANILGYAELLKDELQGNKKALTDLERIISSTIYSREVVKKLMFFSCDMPQHKTQTNIVPIITDAVKLIKPNFSKKQIDCRVITSSEDIPYKVDTIQLTQVVFNLVINAIYFSPEKGTILVEVFEDKKHVYITISDEGSGIQATDAEAIFNPFYTTKPVGEGSGLGLSVVHGIVKSHKGDISHSPNTPQGTIFKISFPK